MRQVFPFQGGFPEYRGWHCHVGEDHTHYKLLVDLEEGADQGVLAVQFRKDGPWALYKLNVETRRELREQIGAFWFNQNTGSLRFAGVFTIDLDHPLYGDIVLAALAQPNAHWDDVFSIVIGKIARGWDWNIWVHQSSITAPFYLQILKMAGEYDEALEQYGELLAAAGKCYRVLAEVVARKDESERKTPLAALVESPQPVRYCAAQVVERIHEAIRALESADANMSVPAGALTVAEK